MTALTGDGGSVGDRTTIVRSVTTSYLSLVVSLVLGFVVTPVLLRGLGEESFGVYALLVSLASFLGLIEVGVGAATVRRVAAARATSDEGRVGRVISSNLTLNLGFVAVALVAVGVLVAVLPVAFDLPAGELSAARVALALLGLGQVVTFLSTGYVALLVGSGRAPVLSVLGTLVSVLTSAGLVLGVLLGAGIAPLALVWLLASVANAVVLRLVARAGFEGVRPRLREGDRGTARELVRAGSLNAVVAAGAVLSTGSDLVVLGALEDAQAVAAYAVAVRAVSTVKTLATRATDVLQPTYAFGQALSDDDRLRRMFTESVYASYLVAGPLAVALLALGGPLLELWLGDAPTGADTVLVLLVVAMLLQLPGHASFTLLTGVERLRFLAVVSVGGGVVNVVLSAVLTVRYGVVGPAIGTLVVVAVVDAVLLPRYVLRTTAGSASSYARTALLPHLLPAGCAGGVVLALRAVLDGGAAATLVSAAACASTYLAVAVATACADRRAVYRRLARSAWPSRQVTRSR